MNLITKLAYNALTKTIQAIAPGGVSIALASSESGRYTPTLTSVSNIAASTSSSCLYMRVGKVVTVSGYIEIDLTTGGVGAELGISLPFASDLSIYSDCAGVVIGNGVVDPAILVGDSTNNRATIQFKNTSAGNESYTFTFQYEIK